MSVLPVATLIIATLFAGAALYITIVEHPARLGLSDEALLAQWQPSYRRALPIQGGLAIAGGLAGFATAWLTGDWRWIAGSLVLLANWPFTLLIIMPVNKRLLAMSLQEAGPDSRRMLLHWGTLHSVRSGLGAVATLLFAWALASPR